MATINLAGRTADEQKLWNTYLFWARVVLDTSTTQRRGLVISRGSNRLPRSTSGHLQAIVFIAFALEYRIKRIYEELGLAHRKRDTLGVLLDNFRRRVETANRLDVTRQVRLPGEWASIEARLKRLNSLRNTIAHANYQQLVEILPQDARRSRALSRSYFNALVDMIRVTNKAIGYDSAPRREAQRYYRKLKIH
jgi:hypothetical protein